jgi:cytochrome c peroxidase
VSVGVIQVPRVKLSRLVSTDYVLVTDKSFKKFAKAYADDESLWFKE